MKNTTTAIVTGASGGIGSAIVENFLCVGYSVIGIDKENFPIKHTCYTHHECDLQDLTKLQHIIQSVELNEHNILVNCAGIREICSISDLTIEKWNEVFSINTTSVFVASQAFAEKIKLLNLKKGVIVNIASISGLQGEPNRTAYVSSKHAVIGLTKQLAIEYGRFGIRANAIAPGVIRTPLTESYYADEEQIKKISSGQFIDYIATPNDIVPLVNFLASDNARFITGTTITADGGWTCGKLI